MLPPISRVDTDSGNYLLFTGRDLISQQLFRDGVWEPYMLQISRLFYQDVAAPLVLDIGANLGAYSIPVARDIAAAGGEVLAFEPQRIIFYQLCANIFLNRLDNCHAHQRALGDAEGVIDIPEVDYARNFNNGAFSLVREYREWEGVEPAMQARQHAVAMMCLDSLALARAPSLIKMDVEGFEIHVLRGAQAFLEQHGWPPLLFEAWSREQFATQRQELLALVAQLGYAITRISDAEYVAQHPAHAVAVEFVGDLTTGLQVRRLR